MSADVQTGPKVTDTMNKLTEKNTNTTTTNTRSRRYNEKSNRKTMNNNDKSSGGGLTDLGNAGSNISGGGVNQSGGGGGAIGNTKKNKHDTDTIGNRNKIKLNRKRHQSFTSGSCGKFFPPKHKRRKKDGIVPPTKFLLGGNICDPLNLNSLQDEEINRAMNAVTPKSSPLPTPKHRKGEVEVLIPPNIYDPLNLNACDDDADYEAMLISPVKRNQSKKQKKNKKRKHFKSGAGGGQGSGKEDNTDETRFSGDEKKLSENEAESVNLPQKENVETLMRQVINDSNVTVDNSVQTSVHSTEESLVQKIDDVKQVDEKETTITGNNVPTLTNDAENNTSENINIDNISSMAGNNDASQNNSVGNDTVDKSTENLLSTVTAVATTTTTVLKGMEISSKVNLKSELNLDLEQSFNNISSSNSNNQSDHQFMQPMITTNTKNQKDGENIVGNSCGSNSNMHPVKKIRKDLKDKIVSPVIPQPGAWTDPRNHWYHRQQPQRLTPQINKGLSTPKFKEKDIRFQYGNYNRYYGYRNANEDCDVRLKVLAKRKDLFEGKDILDVGCNVGHITLAIARDFQPRKVVGVDIDRTLIDAARRNIKHYININMNKDKRYPMSMSLLYGPVDVPNASKEDLEKFPNNVSFIQGNYVLESDILLSMEQPQFDTILCLSITKWFHLNWGDVGLKRAFKRMYAQLRPGGVLILEPQPWHSYKKKRNLTPQIWKNYQNIELFPHKFSQYLLSEVGFTKCDVIGSPLHHSKGFQRPIKLFTKGENVILSNPSSSRTENEVKTIIAGNKNDDTTEKSGNNKADENKASESDRTGDSKNDSSENVKESDNCMEISRPLNDSVISDNKNNIEVSFIGNSDTNKIDISDNCHIEISLFSDNINKICDNPDESDVEVISLVNNEPNSDNCSDNKNDVNINIDIVNVDKNMTDDKKNVKISREHINVDINFTATGDSIKNTFIDNVNIVSTASEDIMLCSNDEKTVIEKQTFNVLKEQKVLHTKDNLNFELNFNSFENSCESDCNKKIEFIDNR